MNLKNNVRARGNRLGCSGRKNVEVFAGSVETKREPKALLSTSAREASVRSVAAVVISRRLELRANQGAVLIENRLSRRLALSGFPLSLKLRGLNKRDDVVDNFAIAGMNLGSANPNVFLEARRHREVYVL